MKKLSTHLMILLLCLATGIHAAPVTHDSQSVLLIQGGEKSHRVQTSIILGITGTASREAYLAARAAKLAKGGAIKATVVVVVAAVVATVLITKKVKKDIRDRRARRKKFKKKYKKYKKLRARAEVEYAHRHMPSKWRNRVRSSADAR
jgi:heme exporter protein D